MNTLRRMKSGLPGVALALCLCISVLALCLYVCGTCAPLMDYMFRTHAPSEATFLPEAHYTSMAQMFTSYLLGTVPEFQYTVSNGEMELQLFHGYEQLHMQDCKGLFDLCRNVLLISAALSAVLLWFVRGKRAAMKGVCIGTSVLIALIAALGAAAAIDFNSIFVLFHQLSFSNDMWMLNPQTDLLIRLMPLELFIHYVCIIGAVWGGFMLLMLGVSARLGFATK